MSYFSPIYQLQLSISQNRPVRLVPQFCWIASHIRDYRPEAVKISSAEMDTKGLMI